MIFTEIPQLVRLYISFLQIYMVVSQKEWRVPDPPENVRLKAGADYVTLWWDPPSSWQEILVRGYTISYGIETPSRKIVIEGVETNAFTVEPLKPSTSYVFSLTAYNEAAGEDGEKVLLSATTLSKSPEQAFNLLAPSEVRANAISPEEIHVSWRDGNPETPAENRVDFMSKHRFYILQYGPRGSFEHKKLTTEVTRAILRGLEGGTEYEISLRTVMPGGQESPWSQREIVKTPEVDFGQIIDSPTEERCSFEDASICEYFSDPNAPLKWRRLQTHVDSLIPNDGYYMYLSSNGDPHAKFGRLISPVYDVQKALHVCLSFSFLVKSNSHGTMLIGLIYEGDPIHEGVPLFKERFEQLHPGKWQTLDLEIRLRPKRGFQLMVEGRKTGPREHFGIGIDNISVKTGFCPKSTRHFGNVS
uniref:Uncharacterized protein n=1 Tax=Acrobeloides nanus TaxID=290746 RepID=A0A914DGP9_9BILA